MKYFFTKRKTWVTYEGRKETYACKFSQRKGYKVCKRLYTVVYPDTDFRVLVFEEEDHFHEEASSYKTNQNYHWTKQQEAIVIRGINTHIKNSRILAQLKKENAVNGSGKFPDSTQVGAKKRYMKNVI